MGGWQGRQGLCWRGSRFYRQVDAGNRALISHFYHPNYIRLYTCRTSATTPFFTGICVDNEIDGKVGFAAEILAALHEAGELLDERRTRRRGAEHLGDKTGREAKQRRIGNEKFIEHGGSSLKKALVAHGFLAQKRTMAISISLSIAAHAIVVQVRTVAELGGTRRNSAATRRNSYGHGTTTIRPRYDHDSGCSLQTKSVSSENRCCISPTVGRADADFGTEGQVKELGHLQENKDESHLRCATAPWSRHSSSHSHPMYKRGQQVDACGPRARRLALRTPPTPSGVRPCAVLPPCLDSMLADALRCAQSHPPAFVAVAHDKHPCCPPLASRSLAMALGCLLRGRGNGPFDAPPFTVACAIEGAYSHTSPKSTRAASNRLSRAYCHLQQLTNYPSMCGQPRCHTRHLPLLKLRI
jgi:hypothetical protein